MSNSAPEWAKRGLFCAGFGTKLLIVRRDLDHGVEGAENDPSHLDDATAAAIPKRRTEELG